jgi:hypothetical protein
VDCQRQAGGDPFEKAGRGPIFTSHEQAAAHEINSKLILITQKREIELSLHIAI